MSGYNGIEVKLGYVTVWGIKHNFVNHQNMQVKWNYIKNVCKFKI